MMKKSKPLSISKALNRQTASPKNDTLVKAASQENRSGQAVDNQTVLQNSVQNNLQNGGGNSLQDVTRDMARISLRLVQPKMLAMTFGWLGALFACTYATGYAVQSQLSALQGLDKQLNQMKEIQQAYDGASFHQITSKDSRMTDDTSLRAAQLKSPVILKVKSTQRPQDVASQAMNHIIQLIEGNVPYRLGSPLMGPHQQCQLINFRQSAVHRVNSLGIQTENSVVPLQRYDYVIELSGTYPALVDFMNELVTQKTLYVLTDVVLSPLETFETVASSGSDTDEKDQNAAPKTTELDRERLQMKLSLAVFVAVEH